MAHTTERAIRVLCAHPTLVVAVQATIADDEDEKMLQWARHLLERFPAEVQQAAANYRPVISRRLTFSPSAPAASAADFNNLRQLLISKGIENDSKDAMISELTTSLDRLSASKDADILKLTTSLAVKDAENSELSTSLNTLSQQLEGVQCVFCRVNACSHAATASSAPGSG